jgi:hypothetical protein
MMQQQERHQSVQQESGHEAGQEACCQRQKVASEVVHWSDTDTSTHGTVSSFQSADIMEQGLSRPKQEEAIVGRSRCRVHSHRVSFAHCCVGVAGIVIVVVLLRPRDAAWHPLRTELVFQFNKALAQKIMATGMANDFQLKVSADASVIVPVSLFRVKVDAHCELTTDVLKVLTDPTGVISKKECTYSYSL